MQCKVVNHMLLVDGEVPEFRESPNISGHMDPTLIVIHYTGDNSKSGAVSWLSSERSGVSAHLVIGKDGSITQLVPFNRIAWHAGVSEWEGRKYVNQFSIGIENVGVGDEWPAAQVEAIRAVIAALFEAYKIENVVGHEDVAPGRKTDPGPNFPWNDVVTRT